MKIFFLFFLLVPLLSLCQSAKFREIRKTPSPKSTIDIPNIVYAVIIISNKVAEKKINDVIKNSIMDYSEEMPLDSAINESTNNGLTDVDYKVMLNKNGILSLKFELVYEGAYPVHSTEYLNFDLNSGAT